MRVSQTKVNDMVYRWTGGADDVVVIAQALAKAGASYLHVASEGRAWFDTALLADGSTVTGLAGEVSGLPVIANGGMHDPEQAARVLEADTPTSCRSVTPLSPIPTCPIGWPPAPSWRLRPGHAASGCHTGHQQQVATGGMIVGRDNGAWRAGAAVVATLTFDVDAETPILAQGARYARHLTTMSHQAFGPDVAVPRILDLLDRLDVPATFFVPGWVAERRPHLVPSIADRGHEVAHHSYSHRPRPT